MPQKIYTFADKKGHDLKVVDTSSSQTLQQAMLRIVHISRELWLTQEAAVKPNSPISGAYVTIPVQSHVETLIIHKLIEGTLQHTTIFISNMKLKV